MNPRFRRDHQGQSLPLMALLMVFLIAMTGLSVDVGHAFSQERQLQDSANAAALAGINTVVSGTINGKKVTSQQVWDNAQRALAGNRVDTAGNQYTYRADYILSNGNRVLLGTWNGSTAYVENGGGNPPDNIIRLQITSTQMVPTFFVRAVGRDDFTVNVNGNACLGGYGLGVLSMGVPLNLKKNVQSGTTLVPYHRIYNADGSLVATTDTTWGSWDKMVGRSIMLPIAANDNLDGSHVAWLSWKGATDNATLAASMTYPSTLQDGFVEGPVADKALPNSQPLNRLTLGDWITGKTGLPSTLASQLIQLKNAKQEIGLPIYDIAGTVSGTSTFHTVKIGLFRVVDSTLTSGSSAIGSNFVRLEYLGDKTAAPTSCAGEPNQDTATRTKKRFNITGVATVDAVWGTPKQTSTATYDIVLVMDTSGSMDRDWNDRQRGSSGYTTPRLNDAKQVIKDFVRNYDVAADPDARLAFITFSGGGNGESAGQLARVVSPWSTSGCPKDTVITPTLCTADMKWSPLQTSANSMNAVGGTPGPVAFETVETLLKNKRIPPAGKTYQQVVIFATDGVFNVCGSVPLLNPIIPIQPCAFGTVPSKLASQINNPDFMIIPGRPIWQAQQVAKRIKQSSVPIFVIALTPRCTPGPGHDCFETKGVPDIASGTDYYFEADDPRTLTGIYAYIASTIIRTECKPGGGEVLAPGTIIRLTQPSNPSFKMKTTAGSDGRWSFKNLIDGVYTIKADPITVTSQDGKSRTYSEVVNKLNPNEEKQATVVINGQSPNGSSEPAALKLTLPRGANGGYPDGCQIP